MKIGNAPIPVADQPLHHKPRLAPEPDAGEAQDGARESTAKAATETFELPAELTAAQARELTSDTRQLIAENNRQAARVHGSLDPRKLLDILA